MKLQEIFTEVFNINAEQVNDNTKLHDIESWDSMTHMILISKIEEVYHIVLTGDEIAEMQSVKAIREILKNKNVKA